MQSVVIRAIEKQDFRTKEAYKTLRTNLEFAGKNVRVISLTSCTPNEGKTSVSFQLAISMAEAGKKTILVDADMRKSVMRGRYKASHEKYGLSHYLSGQAYLDEACCETNIPDFHVIFAGPVPPNPSELLGGDNFKYMIATLRKDYDCVIIDTPPLGSVIDSALIARECDGAVIVIESGAISYKFAQGVKEQLEKADCRILGCVLNKVNMAAKGYYGKYYGRYYGKYYGNEEEEAASLEEAVVKKEKRKDKDGVGARKDVTDSKKDGAPKKDGEGGAEKVRLEVESREAARNYEIFLEEENK